MNLPPLSTEREQAQRVLAELNPVWQNQFSRSFTESVPNILPECNLVQKKTKLELKKKDRVQKRKIIRHINDHFAKTTTMSVLAEAESLASYGRKRLALSYETPTPPQKPKSHSPSEQNMTWDVEGAMSDLENFPAHEKINWSAMARQYNIPSKNAGQVLKETANKHGINTTILDQRSNTPRIRRHKCRLPGGEISIPCLPTVDSVKEEQRQLVLSGELSIGEPCAPFSLTKSIITKDGKVEFTSVEICGRKIPLNELRATILKRQEKFMYLYSDEDISNMGAQDIHAHGALPTYS